MKLSMTGEVVFAVDDFPLKTKKGCAHTGFFILVKSGEVSLECGTVKFSLATGNGAYIPQNKHYKIEKLQESKCFAVFCNAEQFNSPFAFFVGVDNNLFYLALYASQLFACGKDVANAQRKSLFELIVTNVKECDKIYSKVVTEVEKTLIHRFKEVDFDLCAYLDSLPYSSDYVRKLFQKETGETPLSYLTRLRLSFAKSMLDSGNFSVKEVSLASGIKDPTYFSKCYKQRYGVNPKK